LNQGERRTKETEMKGRNSWRIALIALVAAAVGLVTPATARTVVDFARYARNADKVDGLHAVRAGASVNERSNKLVATNKKGYLPNNIIRRAPNAARLGGRPASRFAAKCAEGSVGGSFSIPANLGAQWTNIPGYVFVHVAGGPPPGVDTCERDNIQARRMGVGAYQLKISGPYQLCAPDANVPVTVTPRSDVPLVATQILGCADGFTVLEVRSWTLEGQPAEARLDGSILQPLRIPVP
jgi:hypothetical protein